jgi:hypothetical protein
MYYAEAFYKQRLLKYLFQVVRIFSRSYIRAEASGLDFFRNTIKISSPQAR